MKRIISLTVAILFFLNSVCYGMGPIVASSKMGETGNDTRKDMKALGWQLFGAGRECPINFQKDLPDRFTGSASLDGLNLENRYGVRFSEADYTSLPRGWEKNPILQMTDLIEALKYFRDKEAHIPADFLDIKEGWFPVDEGIGMLPIAQIEPVGKDKWVLVVHTKFVQMWNDIRKNDIWFTHNFTDKQGRTVPRTVSAAWGIFYRLAKHEMTDLEKVAGIPVGPKNGGMGHIIALPGCDPVTMETELVANRITGNYNIINDAIWMWFLGAYCYDNRPKYDNTFFYTGRLTRFFDREDRMFKKYKFWEQFTNLINDEGAREHAYGIAYGLNHSYFSRTDARGRLRICVPQLTVKDGYVAQWWARERMREASGITRRPMSAISQGSGDEQSDPLAQFTSMAMEKEQADIELMVKHGAVILGNTLAELARLSLAPAKPVKALPGGEKMLQSIKRRQARLYHELYENLTSLLPPADSEMVTPKTRLKSGDVLLAAYDGGREVFYIQVNDSMTPYKGEIDGVKIEKKGDKVTVDFKSCHRVEARILTRVRFGSAVVNLKQVLNELIAIKNKMFALQTEAVQKALSDKPGAPDMAGKEDMEAVSQKKIDSLSAMLKLAYPDSRINAALQLGRLQDKIAIPALIEALNDRIFSGPDTRWFIIEALGNIGAQEALSALRETAGNDSHIPNRKAAEEAIKKIEAKAAAVAEVLAAAGIMTTEMQAHMAWRNEEARHGVILDPAKDGALVLTAQSDIDGQYSRMSADTMDRFEQATAGAGKDVLAAALEEVKAQNAVSKDHEGGGRYDPSVIAAIEAQIIAAIEAQISAAQTQPVAKTKNPPSRPAAPDMSGKEKDADSRSAGTVPAQTGSAPAQDAAVSGVSDYIVSETQVITSRLEKAESDHGVGSAEYSDLFRPLETYLEGLDPSALEELEGARKRISQLPQTLGTIRARHLIVARIYSLELAAAQTEKPSSETQDTPETNPPPSRPGAPDMAGKKDEANGRQAARQKQPAEEHPLIMAIATFMAPIGDTALPSNERDDIGSSAKLLRDEQIEIFMSKKVGFSNDVEAGIRDVNSNRRKVDGGTKDVIIRHLFENDDKLETLLANKAEPGVRRIVITADGEITAQRLSAMNFDDTRLLNIALPEDYAGMELGDKTFFQARAVTIAILARLIESDSGLYLRRTLENMLDGMVDGSIGDFVNNLVKPESEWESPAKRIEYFLDRIVRLSGKIGEALDLIKLRMMTFWTAA